MLLLSCTLTVLDPLEKAFSFSFSHSYFSHLQGLSLSFLSLNPLIPPNLLLRFKLVYYSKTRVSSLVQFSLVFWFYNKIDYPGLVCLVVVDPLLLGRSLVVGERLRAKQRNNEVFLLYGSWLVLHFAGFDFKFWVSDSNGGYWH